MGNQGHGPCATIAVKDGAGGRIVINLADFNTDVHERFVAPPPVPVAPPPAAPIVPPSPLDGLPAHWQTALETPRLRAIAQAVGGRMPDNREQAVAIVTEALAARA